MPLPKVFADCCVTLGQSVPLSEKSSLNSQVRKHGGKISAFLNATTTHYLTHHWDNKCFQSDPNQHKILHVSYLTDSIDNGELCDESKYIILPNNATNEEELVRSISKLGTKNIFSIECMLLHYEEQKMEFEKQKNQQLLKECTSTKVNERYFIKLFCLKKTYFY